MTIERRPRQFLAVWSDDGQSVKGSTFEESIFVDGAFWKNELTPVPPDGFADFGIMFSSQLQAQLTQLVEDHKTAIDSANATIAVRDATIATLETRIASLLVDLPFNPRIIDATAFYSRITKDEFAALSVSDDETLRTISKTILAYKVNDWPVVFESPEFQGLIGYLTGTGFLTVERASELTRDATRSEAYDAA